MNPSIQQEISLLKGLLDQNSEVGIVIGSHQNLDTYAAGLALFASLRSIGKNSQIISKKAPTVEVSNLVGIDKVKESFSSGSNSKLIISLPYIKGEVEKVLFTEYPDPQNPTNINFHLNAFPGKSITPFDLKDVKLIWDGGVAPGLIFTIGVSSIDELSGIVDQASSKIVNIDNFAGNTQFGDVILVDGSFSSLSEIAGKIVKDLNLSLDIDTAQNILDGVLFATKNFTKQNTSPFAFEAVSSAMYAGARRLDEGQAQSSMGQRNQQPYQERNRNQKGQQSRARVNENDFPAMHMRGNQDNTGRGYVNQQRNPFSVNQNRQDPRQQQNRPQRQQPAQRQGTGDRRQFGQNPNDIEELMKKINEENARRQAGGQYSQNRPQPQRQQQIKQQRNEQDESYDQMNNYSQEDIYTPSPDDTRVVNDIMMNPPIQDAQMPDDAPYTPPDPSEVPDDWLMPKVFKGSKNNN